MRPNAADPHHISRDLLVVHLAGSIRRERRCDCIPLHTAVSIAVQIVCAKMSVEDIVGAEMAGGFKTAAAGLKKAVEEEPSGDALYTFDEQKLKELRSTTPWMKDPKHFKTVKLSPSAIMKMSMHCQSGVEKGIAKGGNPVEVMGLLIGRPLETKPGTLIVTDAFPLPIEGFETRVVADDQDVVNVRACVLLVAAREGMFCWAVHHYSRVRGLL
jgi:hypothetical protein